MIEAYGDRGIRSAPPLHDDAALLGNVRGSWAYCDRPLLDQVTVLALLSEGHATISIWGKLAEASGVYLACPFTSPSVLTAVMTVPWDVRLREKKHLVRAALRQLGIPETLVIRPKLSFGFPARFWAPEGALFQPIVDIIHDMSWSQVERGASMVLWCILNQFPGRSCLSRSVEDLSKSSIVAYTKSLTARLALASFIGTSLV